MDARGGGIHQEGQEGDKGLSQRHSHPDTHGCKSPWVRSPATRVEKGEQVIEKQANRHLCGP